MTQENVTETEEALPRRRDEGWWRVGVGALLVAIGIDILLEQITGYDINFVTLAIGLVLLAIWWKGPSYRTHGFLIGGSIVSGVGLGQLLSDLTRFDGMFQLGLAAGFAFLASQSHRAKWAWWPAAILGIIGALIFAGDIGPWFLIDRGIASIAAPAVAIALGALLIMRPNIPKATFRTLVIVLIVVGVVMVSALPDRSMFNGLTVGRGFAHRSFHLDLPELDGRTLVVDHDAGSVTLTQGSLSGTLQVGSRSLFVDSFADSPRRGNTVSSYVRIRETTDEVFIEDGSRSRVDSYRLRLTLPPEATARIQTGAGDVHLDGRFTRLEIKTGAGDVSGQLAEPYEELSVETGAGDIELILFGDPTIHASTGVGDLEVNNQDLNGFEREGAGGTVSLQTGAGDIQLDVPGLTA